MPVCLLCQGQYDEQSSITEKTCTSPGWSPRLATISRMRSSFRNPIWLLDVLDLDPRIRRHTFGLGANRLTEWLGELGRVVEQLDAPAIERDRHRLRVTHARQRSLDQHAVEARQHSLDTVTVTVDQVG